MLGIGRYRKPRQVPSPALAPVSTSGSTYLVRTSQVASVERDIGTHIPSYGSR